jgi:hypothetical protein
LRRYLHHPGDGRLRPRIPAHDLVWAQLLGYVLRECSFHAIEALVKSQARRALAVSRGFGDDALGYFCERLAPERTRAALAQILKQAKRNKAFAGHRIGLALDGTAAGWSRTARCALCRPVNGDGERYGYQHRLVLLSVVGTGLVLPIDVEPYGPGDSEGAAGRRVVQRAVAHLGRRFADCVVVDAEYASAPFLHGAGEVGLRVVARLKANLPELQEAARARFLGALPTCVVEIEGEQVELWDAEDFDPWATLQWDTVRVLRYRQVKRNGGIVEAHWLTNFPTQEVSSVELYRLAKSRWEVENQGFNDGKNRYGLDHIYRHHANSVLLGWLLTLLALTIERLYRLRYLRRGRHHPRPAIALVRRLRLSLGAPVVYDTS